MQTYQTQTVSTQNAIQKRVCMGFSSTHLCCPNMLLDPKMLFCFLLPVREYPGLPLVARQWWRCRGCSASGALQPLQRLSDPKAPRAAAEAVVASYERGPCISGPSHSTYTREPFCSRQDSEIHTAVGCAPDQGTGTPATVAVVSVLLTPGVS